jgi:hypothetical protein
MIHVEEREFQENSEEDEKGAFMVKDAVSRGQPN